MRLLIKPKTPGTDALEKLDYAIIEEVILMNSGLKFVVFELYQIKPEKQIQQLTDLGFENVKTFSLKEGKEIRAHPSFSHIGDSWLYYLCNV